MASGSRTGEHRARTFSSWLFFKMNLTFRESNQGDKTSSHTFSDPLTGTALLFSFKRWGNPERGCATPRWVPQEAADQALALGSSGITSGLESFLLPQSWAQEATTQLSGSRAVLLAQGTQFPLDLLSPEGPLAPVSNGKGCESVQSGR